MFLEYTFIALKNKELLLKKNNNNKNPLNYKC